MLEVWEQHAPHPNLPVVLPELLRESGFGAVIQAPATILNRHFRPGTFCYGIARLIAAFAVTSGEIDAGLADSWIDAASAADERGEYFVSVVPVVTTAVRLGH